MPQQFRQLPGSACEECRKRKLRCDRKRPKCETCIKSGLVCEVSTERLPRGPKRGSFSALRSRIQLLEISQCSNRLLESPTEAMECYERPSRPPSSKSPASSRGTLIDDLMRSDLDQLYFDRVHPMVPIMHKSQYYSWPRPLAPGDHRICVQNAMWTLAMSLSSQFENVRQALYDETQQMLEERDLCESDMNAVHIEQVQAWILITFCELLRASYRRAWLSAGRVFRFIQLLRLHEVDSLQSILEHALSPSAEENIMMEEKRRAFWVAYSLDRFTCLDNGLPLTLTEEGICTRLPAPEPDFESGVPSQAPFLSEAIASGNGCFFHPLAECVINVTLYSRALSHCHASTAEQLYCAASQDFWSRHEWINSMLMQRRDSFALNYLGVAVFPDPMLLLSHMVLQTTTIYLYKVIESVMADKESDPRIIEYQKRAISAAQEIARLTKEHVHMSCFKAHVFMPMAMYFSAGRLIIHRASMSGSSEEMETVNTELNWCLEALRKVQSINNLAKHYLELLKCEDIKDLNIL